MTYHGSVDFGQTNAQGERDLTPRCECKQGDGSNSTRVGSAWFDNSEFVYRDLSNGAGSNDQDGLQGVHKDQPPTAFLSNEVVEMSEQ